MFGCSPGPLLKSFYRKKCAMEVGLLSIKGRRGMDGWTLYDESLPRVKLPPPTSARG